MKTRKPSPRGSFDTTIVPGTVIHGTHKEEDLFFAFLKELQRVSDDQDPILTRPGELVPNENYLAMEIVVDLMDKLDEYSPKGMRFGAHEGDGSDFGWWPQETDE
jgi:hypothetical protein